MMTKKDYELIAGVLRKVRRFAAEQPAPLSLAEYAASETADALMIAYPRFDRERFLRACQPESVRGSR